MGSWPDSKDRKILYELDLNCRRPLSKIAKKVGLSTEVVNYRIKKLEKLGIITRYQLVVDLSKLKIIPFKILLSFQHMNSKKLDDIIHKLKSNKSVVWIASCKGNWDLLIGAEAKSLDGVETLKNNILGYFENYIGKKAFSVSVGVEVYNRDYLVKGKEDFERTRVAMSNVEKADLDEIDLKILKQLSINARKTIIDMASELGISERIIDYRIKNLIKNKVITGFRITLNYESIEVHFYKTFIYLDNLNADRVNALIDYFRRNRNIIHNVRVMGNWDLEPEFEVYSETEFNKIITEIQDSFSDIIRNIDVVTISKEHKFVYYD